METRYVTVFLGIVVRNMKGRPHILVCQRHEPECPNAHLKWELPGGKVKVGEKVREAVAREIEEEAGVRTQPMTLLQHVQHNLWEYADHQKSVLVLCYTCRYIKSLELKKDHHVKKVKWLPINRVLKLDFLPGINDFLDEIVKNINF